MAPNARHAHNRCCSIRRTPYGVSLVELLIVVAIIGILAGLAISRFEPGLHDQLRSAAQVFASDSAYARSLAVANNSTYRLQFSATDQSYWLSHSGANAALDDLPPSPFRDSRDPATRQTTYLGKLSGAGGTVELVAVRKVAAGSEQDVTSFDFGSLGALTQSETAAVWFAAGASTARRYVSIQIDPATGLASISDLQIDGPRTLAAPSGSGS